MPFDIALDASGDAWVTNNLNPGSVTELTEFVGAATPVLTPTAACLKLNTGFAVCLA